MPQKILLTIFLIFSLGLSAIAQDSIPKTTKPDNDYYLDYITNYFQRFPPTQNTDSLFFSAFHLLLPYEKNNGIKQSLTDIDNLIKTNILQKQLELLYPFRDTLSIRNKMRQDFLADYWERQRLQAIADTSSGASTDSVFIQVLEQVMYQDTINYDSLRIAYEPYNDTILEAINKSIKIFQKNRHLNWIKQMRKDTSNFYIVDLEGDSLLLKLYNHSPEMVQVNITDYWGKNVQAVVRDIHKNSFRILIDDTPEMSYETEEKAKKAIGTLERLVANEKGLSMVKRPYNPPIKRWNLGGNANVDMSQVALHQWAKGGESTVSILSGLNLFAKYKGDKYTFESNANFKFGVIRQGEYTDTAVVFRPNEDKIDISAKYGLKAFGNYSLTTLGSFKSQFAKAYQWDGNTKTDNLLSEFMSPAYVTFALGLDYKSKKKLKVFLSPITAKSTYVLLENASVRKTFGVDTTKNAKHEMGAIFKGEHKLKIWDDIVLENKLELFSNYVDKPQNIDIDWEFKLVLPVNDYIKATVSTNFIYDDNTFVTKKRINDNGEEEIYQSKGGQFREMLTIGFFVKF